ncbi:MAG: hypothetical protein COV74_04715 [Candidatus Omnitrophica bacterium CG11_big_fil_rev_8_21_14_0_20_45_26]|uniref:Uncharacterized protein n=1 Tax=Candidatus Abzuiibacterium crystallinum TaxID=1974748 RepID=A0A2H0LPZ3_9BACT|nr:MAG: hypothetical protein COV74_04715 [Candidatus Omnitrophica bacterium CG11_big_fil_rev_8_21_14_0_20_45_26]PIW64184.1 MAG: hypothetical protein COW12_07230 [Candidatus Omnitrophica bacterium CG12_big_fil_rev_8_21_14_0_65_45_16]
MRLNVRVLTRSSREAVLDSGDGELKIYVKTVPEKGKANQRICELIAQKYQTSKNRVRILRGQTSRRKVIEVLP